MKGQHYAQIPLNTALYELTVENDASEEANYIILYKEIYFLGEWNSSNGIQVIAT